MVSLGLVGRLPCSWFAACGSQLRSVAVCALAPWLRIGVAPWLRIGLGRQVASASERSGVCIGFTVAHRPRA